MINKRDFLKWGVITGGAALISGGVPGIRPASSQTPPACPQDIPAVSPPVTPFVQALPIPPVLQEVPLAQLDPPPVPGNHQRFTEFPPVHYYEMRIREALHSFHPEMPPTKIWGYNGLYPGPTIIGRYGQPFLIRMHNELPPDHVGYGMPQIITHVHNFHTAWESDGNPNLGFVNFGEFRDHHYASIYAGGDEREALNTLWYHDHRKDFTAPNAYRGLAGFALFFDHKDTGNEQDPSPQALKLPSGNYDVPLVFADKSFDAAGQLVFDQFNFDGFLGDRITVNGAIQPFLKVARRKYRLRLLAGGPSRFYEMFLSDGSNFELIATDGNLLPAPITVGSARLAVAQRRDIVIDFSRYQPGDRVFLENRLEQVDGRGPTGNILQHGTQVLRFDIDLEAADSPPLPLSLRSLPPINITAATPRRTFSFERTQGAWAINGQFYNPDVPVAIIKQGTPEVWTLKNNGGGWSHPVHIHMEEFQILLRNGQTPEPEEIGRHDVVELGPNDEVQIYLQFRDWVGRYVMHCHNTLHEDHAMMIRYDIVP